MEYLILIMAWITCGFLLFLRWCKNNREAYEFEIHGEFIIHLLFWPVLLAGMAFVLIGRILFWPFNKLSGVIFKYVNGG